MNTNPKAIRVICYGDSNTWGRDPQEAAMRFPANVRWTGILQERLGHNYEIIEEGLSGRTTVLDQNQQEDKNGLRYLQPCLESHNPLDVIILMLGTNDFKEQFHQTPRDIARNIEQLVQKINAYGVNSEEKPPKIIVVSPPYVDEKIPGTQEKYKGAEVKSKQLAKYIQKSIPKYMCAFIDSAQYVTPSKIDGYHLDPESHHKIAEILADMIVAMALTPLP